MKNWLKLAASAVLMTGVTGAQADIVGGTIEASFWQGAYSGNSKSGSTEIDLEDDLNFDDGGFLEITASVEHPVPVLPNVKIRHVDLDETATGTLNVTFDNQNFSSDVETNLDLTHSDLILYYEILDNWVSIDIGLDTKIFDGQLDIEAQGSSERSTTDIDEIIPMLYASANFELPFTGLTMGADVSAISYSDSSLTDARIRLRQGFSLAFIELGYRQMAIDIEDVSDIDFDADISGAYISTGLDF